MNLSEINAVVYDIETYPTDTSIKVFDINNQTISIAITYDDENNYQQWYKEDVEDLIDYLLEFDKIIGFNIKKFDNVILDRYLPGVLNDLNSISIDMMEVVEQRLGHRISLNSLVKPTLNISKSASGEMAAQWALDGENEKIIEYCKQDVDVTAKLFFYGLEKGEVFYDYHGDVRKIKIDWLNTGKKHGTTEFTYILDDHESGAQITLDRENKDFFQALELVHNTRNNLFITGKAGTGKTTFLKYAKQHVQKNAVVLAYTGVAAINAGGQTIHSFFQINPQEPPFAPEDRRLRFRAPKDDEDQTTIYRHFKYNTPKRELLKNLELLIIDEVSMVRADFLDVIDKLLRAFSGRNRALPFGGIQVILIGDAFQLPPIEGAEWDILCRFYESPFFFSAQVLKQNQTFQIELKKIYRQTELDFINLLNRVRVNQPTDRDLQMLNSRVRAITHRDFDESFIELCSTNSQANIINSSRLDRLVNEEMSFEGAITGVFPLNGRPAETLLKLKVGAQVMFLKNGPNYYNGKIGTVINLEEGDIVIEIKNSRGESQTVTVLKHTWENSIFTYNERTKQIEKQVIGTFTQYPLKLAWAITVHKSQGLTFEKVIVNINHFAPSGLTYVALSRCISMNGLALRQPLTRASINTDPRVIEYAQNVAPETLITDLLTQGKADELYNEAYLALKESRLSDSYDFLLKAIKYRNDIETDSFRRIVIHLFKKFRHYKNLSDSLGEKQKEMLVLLRKVTDLTTEVNKLTKNEEKLKKAKDDFHSQTQRLELEIKPLKKKVDELAETERHLNTLVFELTKQNKQNKAYKAVMEKSHEKKDRECKELQTENNELLAEISRLRKLTWLQKLFGKK